MTHHRAATSSHDSPDLLRRVAERVDIPSVSQHEKAIADHVAAVLDGRPGLEVWRLGNNVLARTHFGLPRRLLLAGHLDTVPPNGNERATLEGDRCCGLGAADMKGGLAVMLECDNRRTGARPCCRRHDRSRGLRPGGGTQPFAPDPRPSRLGKRPHAEGEARVD